MNTSRKTFLGAVMIVAILAAALVVGTNGAILTPFSDTFAGGVSGTMTRNQIPKIAGASQISDSSINDNGTTVTVTEPVAAAGQVKITKDPASTTNTDAALLVNPATSASSELFLGLLDNGSTVFSVDKGGNVVILGNITLNTNKFTVAASSGNTLVAGTFSATGDFAINTNKFNVTASSGNTTVAGTLVSTGAINGPFGAAISVATPVVLTAPMSGQLFVSNSTADAVQVFTLPPASTGGLTYCFSLGSSSLGSNREIDVEPQGASDLIIGTTNATGATGIVSTAGPGHGMKNTHATAVRGNQVCLQSDGLNTYYQRSLSGTWAGY